MTRKRSIGARSDWSEHTNGAEGDQDGDAETDDGPANGAGPNRTWTIYREDVDPEVGKPRPEEDPDDPINKFVQEQLTRLKSNDSNEFAEELSSQNDGANDELRAYRIS